MTESQRRSAVARKRAAGNPGGKPTNVKTFAKKSLIRYIHFVDIYTISLIQKIISNVLWIVLKDHAIYGVDTMEQLQYVRGQIKSYEDLQQEIKDLLSRTEIENEQVHGDTETD